MKFFGWVESIFTTWSINTSVVLIIGKDYVAVAPLFNCTYIPETSISIHQNHYERYYLSKEADFLFIILKVMKSHEKATICSTQYLQNPKMYQ